ncbi:hypothetical protein FRB90_006417 [Tulasnella sp. 427]|nr:hypothetical protein FRB90_006417 [Tulasnella sp. 427]
MLYSRIQAALSRRSLVCEAWFEICCHCITIGLEIGFIARLTKGIPSHSDLWNSGIVPPFDQVTLVLFGLAFALLAIDIAISLSLSFLVVTAALHEQLSEKGWIVWRTNLCDLLGDRSGEETQAQLEQGSPTSVKGFFERHTLFRRDHRVEPVWLAAVRGTVALAALLAVFAYGILNTLILPTQQFKNPLPRRAVMAPLPHESRFTDEVHDARLAYGTDIGNVNFLDWFSATASSGSTRISCWAEFWSRWNYVTGKTLDIGIGWHCDDLGTLESNGTTISPTVSLTWAGPPALAPILRTYITNDPIWQSNRPWQDTFEPYLTWNVTSGTNTSLSVGRNVVYARPGTFLEMVGLKQRAIELEGYPVVSSVSTEAGGSSQTTIEIIPSFGGYYGNHVDAWEEYTQHSMLQGLAETGLLFGGKLFSPFGSIAVLAGTGLKARLLKHYPGLDSVNRSERSESLSDFLYDIVLDMGPINRPQAGNPQIVNRNQASQEASSPSRRGSYTDDASPLAQEKKSKEPEGAVVSSLV